MNKKVYRLISIVLCFICLFLYSSTAIKASASTSSSDYTDVFDDLSESEDFDIRNYPSLTVADVVNDDTQVTLEIIQIAESSSKELYLYVYQPLNKVLFFTATSISMSCEFSSNGENLHPVNYDLELVSSYDVFCKYVVKDFVVSDEVYRYYNIVCIRRNFDYTLDDRISGTEDDGNEKAISVGQQWCCYYFNDKLVYEMAKFDTLEIKVKYTGNFEFSDGITWSALVSKLSYGDSWFICFDLKDYIASHIYDADLVYRMRKVKTKQYHEALDKLDDVEFGGWSDNIPITLTDADEVTYDGGGLFAKEYTWNRIMSSKDFIKNAEEQKITISDEVKANILNSQWVFSFCETAKTSDIFYSGTIIHYECHLIEAYDIADVTILRIHFLNYDNKIYNLGVVSDRVNPDNKSDGYGGIDEDWLEEWFQKLFMLIGIIVILVLLAVFCPFVFKILELLLKGVWVIISLPFKLIGKLFKTKNKKP